MCLRHNELTPHEKFLGIRRGSNLSTSIDTSSLKIGFLVLIQNADFVRDNGTNQTREGHRGRKPVSKKLLGRLFLQGNVGLYQILPSTKLYCVDLNKAVPPWQCKSWPGRTRYSNMMRMKNEAKGTCSYAANPTWGDIFESSKLKARMSLLPRFSQKRRSSFELLALKQYSKM